MKDYEYFKGSDLACKCGCGQGEMDEAFMRRLIQARKFANIPFRENSAFRCIERNRAEGGKVNSSHLLGMAMDIGVRNSRERYKILEALLRAGFTRIGIAYGFIHVDSDLSKPSEIVYLYGY